MGRAIFLFALSMASSLATAACNNPTNWLLSPTQGIKYFVGYNQPTDGFSSPTYIDEPERLAFPPLLPHEMSNREGFWTLDNVVGAESLVSYYEPDGKGNWRLCRSETWNPRSVARKEAGRSSDLTYLSAQATNSQVVARLGSTHAAVSLNAYSFDSKGRVETKSSVSVLPRGAALSRLECYRYDDKNSVVLYVDAKITRACPIGDPDSRDDWTKVLTIWIGGKRLQSRVDRNFSLEAGVAWRRVIGFRSPDGLGPGGTAYANSRTGIEKIVGAAEIGPRDDDDVNVAPKRNGIALKPLEYHFTKPPVPVELIDHLDTIYSYDRRRELAVASAFRWVEWFPAGKTIATNAYLLGAGSVIRHEQRDYAGKLKRAINVAFENFAGRPDALYSEAAITKPLLLKGHEYLYRVWDYGATGAPTLVAIGWNRSLRSKPLDSADVAFGTPDGKIKWKDKEAFFQAVGFDAEARGAHLGATN